MIDRIVEPFFTTKEVGKGAGLGLSMVAGFAQQSGGKLAIRSSIGVGTTMELILPATSEPLSFVKPAGATLAGGACRQRSVLLVDDDDAVREILSQQLTQLNLEVFAAASGGDALEVLAKPGCNINILLTDFAMPGLNGTETIARAEAPSRRSRPSS